MFTSGEANIYFITARTIKEEYATGNKVTIKTDGIHAKISINGVPVDGVRGYSVKHTAGGIPEINFNVICTELDFESDTLPQIPEPWATIYKQQQDVSE